MRTHLLTLALSGLALALSVGCGGKSTATAAPASTAADVPPVAATTLTYTDPTGSGWLLVQDPSSTPARLVLNLVGPTGLMTRGVGFNLQGPSGLKFDVFATGLPINDLGVYELLSANPNPGDPVALTGALKPGNLLSAGIFQKGRDMSAKDAGAPLCQIALVLDPAVATKAGTAFTLTVPKARIIPGDIGLATDSVTVLSQKMQMQNISITAGSLSAN